MVKSAVPIIPRKLHCIWIGDESKRPDNCIESWRNNHREWEFFIWGNKELQGHQWENRIHISSMLSRELNGVADMMRWEILHAHGGVLVDADSYCLSPLDNDFLHYECFACWENEIARPGLIATGYFGSVPNHALLRRIIDDIKHEESVTHASAWQTVGPLRLTRSVERHGLLGLKVLPSYYFIPEHYTGLQTYNVGPVYANQYWGSTDRLYDSLYKEQLG